MLAALKQPSSFLTPVVLAGLHVLRAVKQGVGDVVTAPAAQALDLWVPRSDHYKASWCSRAVNTAVCVLLFMKRDCDCLISVTLKHVLNACTHSAPR